MTRFRLIFFICISIFAIVIVSFYYFSKYKSAFEADQQCHYELAISDSIATENLGCDHDLETKQWILYETQLSNKPAKVLKRFKY